MSGESLDLSSEDRPRQQPAAPQRFVGIHFTCCDIYVRVYLNRAGTAYQGHCPRCSKRVELKVGPDGTDKRFFRAY